MPNPSTIPKDVVTAILNGTGGLTSGTNLFSIPPRPANDVFPRNCVFVFSNFSFLPHTYLGVNKDYRQFLVNVVIRQGIDQFATGYALGLTLWAKLQRASLSGYTGYVSCTLRESEPIYQGVDDTDNHRWVMTCNLEYVG